MNTELWRHYSLKPLMRSDTHRASRAGAAFACSSTVTQSTIRQKTACHASTAALPPLASVRDFSCVLNHILLSLYFHALHLNVWCTDPASVVLPFFALSAIYSSLSSNTGTHKNKNKFQQTVKMVENAFWPTIFNQTHNINAWCLI